tara:strand:+ start:556 stop:705 length:150 start_codon:yes stop_codon:yes gene_type:complete
MGNQPVKDKESRFLIFGKIPIVALIFPPLGLVLLIRYYLNKKTQKGGLK